MKRWIMAFLMCLGTMGATAGVASASKFGPNPFGAGNSPACQPGKGLGDNGKNHVHLGPPGKPGNLSAQDIHKLDLANGNKVSDHNCVPPKPPTPPRPPTPPKPPGPVPVVPGHGQVSPTAAVTPSRAPQRLASVQQQTVPVQQVTVAPPAAPVQTIAHFTG